MNNILNIYENINEMNENNTLFDNTYLSEMNRIDNAKILLKLTTFLNTNNFSNATYDLYKKMFDKLNITKNSSNDEVSLAIDMVVNKFLNINISEEGLAEILVAASVINPILGNILLSFTKTLVGHITILKDFKTKIVDESPILYMLGKVGKIHSYNQFAVNGNTILTIIDKLSSLKLEDTIKKDHKDIMSLFTKLGYKFNEDGEVTTSPEKLEHPISLQKAEWTEDKIKAAIVRCIKFEKYETFFKTLHKDVDKTLKISQKSITKEDKEQAIELKHNALVYKNLIKLIMSEMTNLLSEMILVCRMAVKK